MKLIGLKYIPDYETANKYLKLFKKLRKMEVDFGKEKISAEEDWRYNREFTKEWSGEIWIITLYDGEEYQNYMIYEDMDDGYRSYIGEYKFSSKINKIIDNVEYLEKEVEVEENIMDNKKDLNISLRIKKDNEVIYEALTDESDGYYPVAQIHYYGS